MANRPTIPTGQPNVFDVVLSLSELKQQAIIRTSNPPPGFAGFLFDIPDDDELRLTSDISKHWLENNTTVQDQIALNPVEYTVKGLVAELAAITPRAETVAKIPEVLPINPSLAPELTGYQLQKQVQNINANAIIAEDSQDLWQLYGNKAQQPPNQTKQARTLFYFLELWKARQLFTVETPWGVLDYMAIAFLSANQNDETKFASSFTITFQQINFAGTATVNVGQLAGRAASQMATVSNNGNAGTTTVTAPQVQSLLFLLLSAL